jgi:opacity protein-like surface antigen
MSTKCRQIWRPSRTFGARFAQSLFLAGILAVPALAHAQEPKKDCEPGSWFCGETQTQTGQTGKDLQPLPENKPAESTPADKTPPPVVVYQPPPPTVVVQARDAPPPYYYVPRKAPPKKEWGLNLHLGGAMMGKGRDDNAGMLLTGVGLRFRPIPQAAIEGVLDFAGGRDYNGYQRKETSFSVNGLIFLNPKNTTQVYLLGGFGKSWAWATDDSPGATGNTKFTYDYFGVQAGIGLEFRLAKSVALNVDLRGLIRGRTDDNTRLRPEFVSADGRTTNTSGAGLLTGGITFYW